MLGLRDKVTKKHCCQYDALKRTQSTHLIDTKTIKHLGEFIDIIRGQTKQTPFLHCCLC